MILSEANKILTFTTEKKLKITTAESCTGGLIISSLIENSGASKVIDAGIVCYSNSSKSKLLNIPLETINKYGAVSEEMAILMANKSFRLFNSDICIATTGIAGPKGGSKLKPVGLVYFALKLKKLNKTLVAKKNFTGERNIIQKKAVKFALSFISDKLNIPM